MPVWPPRVKQSGEMKLGGTYMSKCDSPYLRRASIVVVKHDPMSYYKKKGAEGMRYMSVMGHTTRRMTVAIFDVL